MARRRPLARPPIKEALVDFRIASDPPVEPERLQALRPLIISDYPKVEEKKGYQAEFRFDKSGRMSPTTSDLGFHGLFFNTADDKRIAQFRRDGFTLNQLAPYSTADDLIREALRLWDLYRDNMQPPRRYASGVTLHKRLSASISTS
jgi:uncharacterized protein (TIGR04255 family)